MIQITNRGSGYVAEKAKITISLEPASITAHINFDSPVLVRIFKDDNVDKKSKTQQQLSPVNY